MLLHIERDVYKKAFGKLIFSNSKLDVYTKEGKLCSVNRDLLVFFSPFIKELLKDVPNGIRASLVLPNVSLDCLQHVFKVISNGFTDFARIQDLKAAGDLLGINLDCLEYVENNAGKDLSRAETKKKSEISTLDINNIKKEIIDVEVIKKEASEEVTNLVSKEISLSLQAKKYDAGIGCVGKSNGHNKDLGEIDAVECADKTPHTTHPVPTVGAYKKYQSPARIRRSIRRALMHKAMKDGEKGGDSKLDKIAVDSTNKVDLSKSLRKPSFKCRSSQYTDKLEQYSQMYQWENTTYKSKIHGNRKSTWQAKQSEYVEYKKSKIRDSWKSRKDERRGELTRKAPEMSRSPSMLNREQNPFYTPEEGEIE